MQKRNIYFEVNLSQPVVLLLEPLQDSWSNINKIADGVTEALFGRLNKIYFIGNRKVYSVKIPKDFRQNSPIWFNENKDRVMLISPIFENLEKEGYSGMIALICSKLPIDAMDWYNSDVLERTLFVNIGDKTLGEDYNELCKPDISQITDALNNPTEELYIKTSDFLPLCWQVDSARIEAQYDEGEFCLKIYPDRELLNIHIIALCENIPQIEIIRKKGSPKTSMGKEEQRWFSEPTWEKLPDKLKPVLLTMKKKEDFLCPQCETLHSYNTFICPEGDIILKNLPHTLILLKGDSYLTISDWFAYPLSDKKAITKDSELYEYKGSRWYFIKKITPFEEVENGIWAFFHRV